MKSLEAQAAEATVAEAGAPAEAAEGAGGPLDGALGFHFLLPQLGERLEPLPADIEYEDDVQASAY